MSDFAYDPTKGYDNGSYLTEGEHLVRCIGVTKDVSSTGKPFHWLELEGVSGSGQGKTIRDRMFLTAKSAGRIDLILDGFYEDRAVLKGKIKITNEKSVSDALVGRFSVVHVAKKPDSKYCDVAFEGYFLPSAEQVAEAAEAVGTFEDDEIPF